MSGIKMELEKGKTPYSNMTFPCERDSCFYYTNGRCIYNVARIKIEISRACHLELVECETEDYLDYMDGLTK